MVRKAQIFPKKSPKRRSSRSLVSAILTTTARILETGDYAKVTTNRIAKLAGVSIGSVYEYFPSKEALIGAIVDQAIERNQKRFEARLNDCDGYSFDELIGVMVQAAADSYLRNRKIRAIMFEQAPQLQKTEHVLKLRKHMTAQLKQVVERYKGEVRPKNREVAAFVSVNAVLGVFQMMLLDYPDGIKETELVREVAILVRRYFL